MNIEIHEGEIVFIIMPGNATAEPEEDVNLLPNQSKTFTISIPIEDNSNNDGGSGGGSTPNNTRGNTPSIITEDDTLLNSILNTFIGDVGNITYTGNPNTYSYLHYALKSVEDEWNNNINGLFDPSNFEELVKYHGNDSSKENSSHEGMKVWIIALCLVEILPNKAENIYKKAYNFSASGNNNDVYSTKGGFTIKGDINICRLVAAVLWAINRSKYNNDLLSKMRSEVHGTTLSGDIYSHVGDINYNNIFPSAPGPFVKDAHIDPLCKKGNRYPPTTQTQSLFYSSEEPMTINYANDYVYSPPTKNWTKYNYKVDVAVDDEVVSHYNLDDNNYYKRTAQAAADSEEDPAYYFSNRAYYKRKIKYRDEWYTHNTKSGKITVHDKGNEVIFMPGTASDNDGYIDGPFNKNVTGRDLSNCAYEGDREDEKPRTAFSELASYIRYTAAQSRKSLLSPQYGRRRPGQGEYNIWPSQDTRTTEAKHYRGGGNRYHPLGFIRNFSVEAVIGGACTEYDMEGNSIKGYYFDKVAPWKSWSGDTATEDYFTIATDLQGQAAHTYPSGHSSGIFGLAITLIRLLPGQAKQILKAAYSYTVSRTIVRAHWNSDIIYGRLIGSMFIPYIQSNTIDTKTKKNFTTMFSKAAAYLNVPEGGSGYNSGSNDNSSNNSSDNGNNTGYSFEHGGYPCHGTISKLTIKNNSGYDWSDSQYHLSCFLTFYIVNDGGTGTSHVGIDIPLYNNSTYNDLVEPIPGNNPYEQKKCRHTDFFELANGNSIEFKNVYFVVKSKSLIDYNAIPSSGIIIQNPDESHQYTHKMYIGGTNIGDVTRNNTNFRIRIMNDDNANSNKFKGTSGSSYTIIIEKR